MPARLTLYPADGPARQFPLESGREYLIGRGPDCDLCVQDLRLSRRHARLAPHGNGWRFDDLDSKNGTKLAGRAVADHALQDGDWISFGGLLGQFADVTEERAAAEHDQARARWQDTIERSRWLDPRSDVEQLLAQVLAAAMQLAGAERGFVMLGDESGRLSVRARAGDVDPARADIEFPGSRGVLARTLAGRSAVVVCDASADTLLGAQPSILTGRIRALACLPLAIGGQLTGLLYLDSRLPGKIFTRLDLEILEAFATHAALVVGVAKVREELAEVADLLPRELGGAAAPETLVRQLKSLLPPLAAPAIGDGAAT